MTVMKTAVGPVDKKVLEKLHESFDTRKILDAVSDLDEARWELEEPGGPRNDLFRLHDMAMYLFDDDAPPAEDDAIWELADELSSRILRCREALEKVEEVLDELIELMPDDDDSDDAEDLDE
jgi:hypothetical protein